MAVDDDSVKQVGRWPWSREVVARLFSRIKEAQARVMGLDIIFAERQETAAAMALQSLRRGLARENAATPQVLALMAQEEKRADLDRRLAETISQGSPTVLGFYFKQVGAAVLSSEPPQDLEPAVIQVSTYNMVRRLDQKAGPLPMIGAAGVEVNLPAIATTAAGGGYFNMIPDADGTVRWYPWPCPTAPLSSPPCPW